MWAKLLREYIKKPYRKSKKAVHRVGENYLQISAHFGSTYTTIGTIQRLAWPLRKDDKQIHEAFHIFYKQKYMYVINFLNLQIIYLLRD